MQAEIRKPELQSIEEAIAKGYTFHIGINEAETLKASYFMTQ
jgi:hypothetical protein